MLARTPGTLTFHGVEWVDTGAHPLDTTRAVAERLWHHVEAPRTQRIANATVFRFDDGRVDPAQRLTFGSYRLIEGDSCLVEKLFIGDDLPAKDRRIVEKYVESLRDMDYGVGYLGKQRELASILQTPAKLR